MESQVNEQPKPLHDLNSGSQKAQKLVAEANERTKPERLKPAAEKEQESQATDNSQ